MQILFLIMISKNLLFFIMSSILIVLAIIPCINGDQKWYYQSDLSQEESQSHFRDAKPFDTIDRSDSETNTTGLYYSSDIFDQLNKQNKTNETFSADISGRSAKMFDLDDFQREPRIINDKELSIKGFIPIVGFGNDKHDTEDKPSKQNEESDFQPYMSQSYPQQMNGGFSHQSNTQKHVSRPEDQRFIGAALQGLAATLSGKPTRKQGFGYEPTNFGYNNLGQNAGCVCVPFYMCKNGYLTESAKNSIQKSPNIETAQSIINQFALPAQYSQPQNSYQQKHQISSQSEFLPIDERSIDGSHQSQSYSANNSSAPQYADDVLARMLGVRSDGCGVLRTCCRPPIPETELLLGSLTDFPSHANFPSQPSHLPGYSEINKRYTHNQQPNIQQYQDYIKPQRPYKYDFQNKRPIEAFPSQVVQASYGFPPKHLNHNQNYGSHLQQVIPQIPIPVKQEYQFNKPVHHRPVSVYPGFQPQPSPHSLDDIDSHQSYGTCGIRQAVGIHGRVQNLNYRESSTEFGEFPWQVALLKRLGPADSLYVCGGAIISPLFIVTAAHCVKKYQANDLKIRLGEWDVHREDEFYPYIEKYIDDIIIHPEFFPGNLLNDIALIRMETPLDLHQYPHIAPVCLPEPYEIFAGHRCFVSGWGKNSFGHQGEFQSVLTKVDVPVLSHGECEHALKRTRLGYNYQLHPSMICAGGEPGKDACEGDGGSGMVCDVRGIWKVVGLVSWGVGCGQPGVPGVYTNMAHMKPWIDSIVLRYSSGSIGSVGNLNTVYGVISERSFENNKNSTETNEKHNRETSDDFETSSTTLSSV